MKSIAVAGGSGPVGKSIVDGLVTYGHDVFVLSRTSKPSQRSLSFIQADYSDFNATSQALEAAGVEIVVSAIGVLTPETNSAQINLIRAAAKAQSVRRFIISSFDMLHKEEDIELSPLTRYTFEAIKELETTDLEYTRVANGWFADYYGMPYYSTYLHPWINVMSMEKKWAVIPGDGLMQANFITTHDMARFVAHLMDLDTWDRVSPIIGHTLSFNDLVSLAEEARGSKFRVAHDSLESLQKGKISFASEFPPIGFGAEKDEALFAMLHCQAGIGRFLVPTENNLDAKFPHIQLTTPSEVMEVWKGK